MKKNDLDIEELFGEGLMAELTEDIDEAIAQYTIAADGGSLDAMSRLGYIYYSEKGYKNTAEAFKWYTRTFAEVSEIWEENGDAEELEPFTDALVALGEMYEHGFGTGVDKKRAFEYAKRGVEVDKKDYGEYTLQGCAEILAHLYHTGTGTEKNDTLALDLLRHCHQTTWVINFIKEITG